VVAVVPAAGAGVRLPGPQAKPYREVGGRPILARAVEGILAAPSIGGIVIAAAAGDEERARSCVPGDAPWVRVVTGGAERFDSVCRGLEEVPEGAEIVVVHDGVRPFVTVREIEGTIALARERGGALVVTSPVETVKRVEEDQVVATLERSRIRLAQTPQAFRIEIMREAFRRAAEEGVGGTDEAAIVERYGGEIGTIPADRWNIKITVEEDLRLAAWIIEERNR